MAQASSDPRHSRRQAMFDKAAAGVLTQGKPSASSGRCRYIMENYPVVAGEPEILKCGVGHLLPSDAVCRYFDDEGVVMGVIADNLPSDSSDIKNDAAEKFRIAGFEQEDADFLTALQSAHDHASDMDLPVSFQRAFRDRMGNLAVRFKLDPAVLFADYTNSPVTP